ncbi:hypothetical protein ACFPK5_15845 [Streptomyces beijiangensis]|uniref:hypothetical protein n=1 Tax=Streptomyces beijiangensis TaxID=163361 RepID=UPI00361FA192
MDQRTELARAGIVAHGVYAKQYQLELLATPEAAQSAKDAAYQLLLYRDAVAAGVLRASTHHSTGMDAGAS